MARIKTVLTERQSLHHQARQLLAHREAGKQLAAGELQVEMERKAKRQLLERRRKFRQRVNYRKQRKVLFV